MTGSLGFFAPEMLHPEGYDGPPADVWSAGVLALEVLIGTPDFDALWFVAYKTEYDRGTLMRDRRADEGFTARGACPRLRGLRPLVLASCQRNPSARRMFVQALTHRPPGRPSPPLLPNAGSVEKPSSGFSIFGSRTPPCSSKR